MSATASVSDRNGARRLWRALLLAHRWLGIGLGVLVLAWCLSGVVLMYVPYPELDRREALAGLLPLALEGCCRAPAAVAVSALAVDGFRVEQDPAGPVLRATLRGGEPVAIDLGTGALKERWSEPALVRAGEAFAAAQGWAPPVASVRLERDQWTVHGRFDAHRPLLKLGNEPGREWYLSSITGEVLQETQRWERGWSWVGAVTHWLYATALRRHTGLWSEVVIWLTVVSLFLTVTGIVIGVRHFRAGHRYRAAGRRSPFRGWTLWHHYAGLAFGVLTLSWLASGLLSMNPWGALAPEDFRRERAALNGTALTVGDAGRAVTAIAGALPAGTVRLESVGWMGQPYLIAWDRQGRATRLSRDGAAQPVSRREAQAAAAVLRDSDFELDLLEAPDAYHYALKGQPELPVYRITYRDDVRFYVSPATGTLLTTVGARDAWFRWLFDALHRGDFSALARTRPFWDAMMLLALSGVIVGVGSGAWLGLRRLGHKRPNSGGGALR